MVTNEKLSTVKNPETKRVQKDPTEPLKTANHNTLKQTSDIVPKILLSRDRSIVPGQKSWPHFTISGRNKFGKPNRTENYWNTMRHKCK